MPRYGDKIPGLSRWEVVNYVRQLQAAALAPRGPCGARPRGPDHRKVELMATTALRERVVARSITGRYGVFLGLGGVLTLVRLLLIILATMSGPSADRAWHLFHVNWLFFTGLAAGSIAFTAVQKMTKGPWSGLIIRFSQAVSLPADLVPRLPGHLQRRLPAHLSRDGGPAPGQDARGFATT